ncbi:MAG: hypothetical protein LBC62_10500 [Treponema sp.]|jgi:hypothetical protein|nr:hypothetical protein [Treponema sp.]
MTFLLLLLFALFPALLPAQTAAELDDLLESPAVTYAQAARFVLASLDASGSGPDTDAEAAFAAASGRRWLPAKAAPDKPVRLGELSFLMTRAFNIRGGFMYALLPGPRYAFRAMVSRSLIQGAADPAMTVSGERFLHILGNALAYTGGE